MPKEKIKNIEIPAQEEEKEGKQSLKQIHAMKYNKLYQVGNFIWVKPKEAEKWIPGRIRKWIPGRIRKSYEHFLLIDTDKYPLCVSWIDLYLGDIGISLMSWEEVYKVLSGIHIHKGG